MGKTKKSWNKLIVILVLLTSLYLRLYKVTLVPYGFDGDEVAFGYYGYSLLVNHSDEYGNKLPLYFPSIGDYKYPVYAYLTMIPVYLFGLNVFASRFISVIAGASLTIVVYFIVKELSGNRKLALFASVLTAVSPYSLIFSRGAYESNLALVLVSLGILFYLRAFTGKSRKAAILYVFFFVLAIFTYSAARLFTVLFIGLYSLYLLYSSRKTYLSNKALIFSSLIIIFIALFTFTDKRSLVRAKDIGFLNDPTASKIIEDSIHEDGIVWNGRNLYITRMFHNKLVTPFLVILGRYLQHFDPVYLFVTSNPSIPKYSIPNFGLFYLIELLTIPFGIYYLVRKNNKMFLFALVWISLSAIPSALTVETPNPIRALIGLPAWLIISASGFYYFYLLAEHRKAKVILLVIPVLFAVNVFYFMHQYFIHDAYHEPWYTDGGVETMVKSVNELKPKYKKVVISGDPYIFFLFYNKVRPQDFLSNSNIKSEEVRGWERVEEYDNIIFKMPYVCPKIGREKVLYVCRGTEIPQNSIVRDVIRFNDNVPAFALVEFIPYSERKMGQLPTGLTYMVDTDLSYEEGLLDEASGKYW